VNKARVFASTVRHALVVTGFALAPAVHAQREQHGGASYPKGQYAALDALPDWGGIWFLSRSPPGAATRPPQLKGEYLARHEQWRRDTAANDGQAPRSRSNCSPPGMPRIMRLAQYPYEFVFSPGRVTINQEAWMQTRTVWTDGRSHPEDPDPSFMGYSIGHWEGETLVVETIGIADTLEIDTGYGHSDKLRITERIHLAPSDADVLVDELRLVDPEALAEPFETVATYRRDRSGTLLEFQCSQNDRNPVDAEGRTQYVDAGTEQ
jgi:hypothetical protein